MAATTIFYIYVFFSFFFNKGLQKFKSLNIENIFEHNQLYTVNRKSQKTKILQLLQMMSLYFDKGLQQFKNLKKINLFECNQLYNVSRKAQKTKIIFCLLKLVACPKLVASGFLSESSGFRARNPANQSIPASLEIGRAHV